MTDTWSNVLKQLIAGQSLGAETAAALMAGWLAGEIGPELSGALLAALQCKGVDAVELAAMAGVLQRLSLGQGYPRPDLPVLLDTCGTGGDGTDTFNISTAVAFVAAAAGVPVAKHGNRAVSSKSGSADVLEALGIHLGAAPDRIAAAVTEVGITFLFAPHWHPAMKAIAPVRKALGIRTVFNLIGPLVNPLAPTAQVLGVYSASLIAVVAEALRLLGRDRAVVLHSREGMDEAGLGDVTDAAFLTAGTVRQEAIDPQALGLARADLGALKGGSVAENAEILRSLLQGKGTRAQRDCVALNAGLALQVGDRAATLAEGVRQAGDILDAGTAWDKVEALAQFLQA